MIYIIGIGPGNSIDYLTLKAYKIIKNVDVGIYIGEMLGEEIMTLFNKKKLFIGQDIDREKVRKIICKEYTNDKKIALLMSGDPVIYSGQYNGQLSVNEYINIFNENSLKYEIIPGISSMNALCASLNIDLTSFSNNQNIFTTSIERLRNIKQFNHERISKVFSTQPNLVFYQSFRDWHIIREIAIKHYKMSTKVIFAYKISWQDEIIIETNLKNAEQDINGKELSKHTIILILPNI